MQRFFQNIFRRIRQNESGAAAVEFAFIGPLLAALFLGVFDVGTMVYDRTDIHSAARSGAQYFMAGGTDLAVAQELITDSWTSRSETALVSVEKCCKCAGVDVECGTLCDDDSVPDIFFSIEIKTQLEGVFGEYDVAVSELVRAR